ncbi:hypothetical protein CRYUN_Cryun17cG0048700 [Craigia yunnanensis]
MHSSWPMLLRVAISTSKSSLEELLIMISDKWLESGFGFGSSAFFSYFSMLLDFLIIIGYHFFL